MSKHRKQSWWQKLIGAILDALMPFDKNDDEEEAYKRHLSVIATGSRSVAAGGNIACVNTGDFADGEITRNIPTFKISDVGETRVYGGNRYGASS